MYNPYSYALHRSESSALFVSLALKEGLLHTHLLLGVFSPAAHSASILLSSKASVLESYPSVVPKENQYKHSNKLGKDFPNPDSQAVHNHLFIKQIFERQSCGRYNTSVYRTRS